MEVYLDNSATSWPKPSTVAEKMSEYLIEYGANPGKSGHKLALRAAREIFETRELIADIFNVPKSEKVIFTSNATHSLNIVLKGLLNKGDHVITTCMEHNCVIRPLRALEKEKNIEITMIPCDVFGYPDLTILEKSFRHNTKAVVTLHGSNVSGTILPINKIGKICYEKNIPYILDASQTVGLIPVNMLKDNICVLVFTGHKKLYGPPGIGVFCLNNEIDIPTFIEGGTGSNSESDYMPDFYPDKHEAGTKNTVGIIGLKAGIEFINTTDFNNSISKLNELTKYFLNQLLSIEKIKVYGPPVKDSRLPVISINIANMAQSEVAAILDRDYGIMVRSGLHCAPHAHKTIGSFPNGTVRFSLGYFNTQQEINYTINSLKEICLGY